MKKGIIVFGLMLIMNSCSLALNKYIVPVHINKKFDSEIAIIIPDNVLNYKYPEKGIEQFPIGEAIKKAANLCDQVIFANCIVMNNRFAHNNKILSILIEEPSVEYNVIIDPLLGILNSTDFHISIPLSFYKGNKLISRIVSSSRNYQTDVYPFTSVNYVSRKAVAKGISEAVNKGINNLLNDPEILNQIHSSPTIPFRDQPQTFKHR
jgi:hypothetical protein